MYPLWACGPGDSDLRALLVAAHAADWDDLAPQLAVANLLGARVDPREAWVRAGCDLWAACRTLSGLPGWRGRAEALADLTPVCESVSGWRLSCLWGVLVAWHAPAGDGSGPMGRTWVDSRIPAVVRGIWWWALGLSGPGGTFAGWIQASEAQSQADAAGRQADVAWVQAPEARGRAGVARSQADAARGQVDATWGPEIAAWIQSDVVGCLADAARGQVDVASGSTRAGVNLPDEVDPPAFDPLGADPLGADPLGPDPLGIDPPEIVLPRIDRAARAREAVWAFARAAWELCVARLPTLSAA